MQLRPSLDYLTALDERSKEERRRERAGEGEDDSEDEKKEEVAKAVAVRLLHLSTVFERCLRPTQATFPAAQKARRLTRFLGLNLVFLSARSGLGQACARRWARQGQQHKHPDPAHRVGGAVGQDGLARDRRASLLAPPLRVLVTPLSSLTSSLPSSRANTRARSGMPSLLAQTRCSKARPRAPTCSSQSRSDLRRAGLDLA